MARQRFAAVLVLTVSLALPFGAAAAAAATGTAEKARSSGGEVTKAGWWWMANQPPEEAETGLVAYPQQSPPNVPAGSLPVAATAGEPDKVSALELRLAGKPGARAKSARIVLHESASPGANTNAEAAVIVACPVTEAFWADGTAARWDAKPAFDCDLARAEGVRDEEGRWTFDLTSLAALWLGATPTSPSFVLVEAVEAPESFQVTFDGLAAENIEFHASYLPVTDVPGGGDAPVGTGGTPAGSGAGGPISTDPLPSRELSGDPGASLSGAGGAPVADDGTVTTTAPVTSELAPAAAAAVVQPWHAGLTKPAVFVVPLVLGLAYLAMLALGPDAQPTASSARHGVSRALDRLRATGSKALAGVTR